MLEAKYFKDYKHNYMILQCGQEAAARSYQYKILTSDKIRRFSGVRSGTLTGLHITTMISVRGPPSRICIRVQRCHMSR